MKQIQKDNQPTNTVKEGQQGHTPGKLYISDKPYEMEGLQLWLGEGEEMEMICSVMPDKNSNHYANAARIVKCWNEYDGLKEEIKKNQSEWAEMIVDLDCRSKENELLKEENNRLKESTKKLLTELRRIRDTYDNVEDLAGKISREAIDNYYKANP